MQMNPVALVSFAFLAVLLSAAPASAQYEDSRCKCICPSDGGGGSGGANGTSNTKHRRIWITTVPFDKCTCEHVVDPLPPKASEFCLRCECKSETRSTAIQKVVVGLVLCIISGLCLYMLFLSIMQPLLVKARLYQPHVKLEEQSETASAAAAAAAGASAAGGSQTAGSMVDRARHRQERWTRAVEVQRERVYNQHSMLN